MGAQRPNTRVQRTRSSPSAPHSPLTRHPLGAGKGRARGAAGLVIGLSVACQYRTPCVYEVPEGFQGWVLISFQHPECPPIPLEGGKLVFRIPPSGVLCTSSTLQTGWARDEYYFVGKVRTPIKSTGWGGGGGVWLESNGQCGTGANPVAVFANFFVGSEEETRNPPPSPEDPRCR